MVLSVLSSVVVVVLLLNATAYRSSCDYGRKSLRNELTRDFFSDWIRCFWREEICCGCGAVVWYIPTQGRCQGGSRTGCNATIRYLGR